MKWSSREYLIAFNMVNGIGEIRLQTLVTHLGALEKAWNASYQDLIKVPGFGPALCKSFIQQRVQINPKAEIKWASKHQARILTYLDPTYPDCLKHVAKIPPVIYYKGTVPPMTGVAIVGSRKPTNAGKQQAYDFSRTIAGYGVPIISGLARGIDTQVHRGALDAAGFTVAVLGTRISDHYPPENQNLHNRIAKFGCLISEFPSTSTTVPGNFPRRNRLIAAFSAGVLVVEAGLKSGTLSTVDWALELGKDVWAVPGEIAHPNRQGCHRLIKQGAGLVDHPEEIIASLKIEYPKKRELELDQTTASVLKYYRQGYSMQEIVDATTLSAKQVLACITYLEIAGLKNTQ